MCATFIVARMDLNETLVLEDHTTLGIWLSIASHNATETGKFVGSSGVLNYQPL